MREREGLPERPGGDPKNPKMETLPSCRQAPHPIDGSTAWRDDFSSHRVMSWGGRIEWFAPFLFQADRINKYEDVGESSADKCVEPPTLFFGSEGDN